MPASLRFVGLLLTLGAAGALGSGWYQYHQTEREARTLAEAMTNGRVNAGKLAIDRYGCGACHYIPGVADARGRVGPSLRAVARRSLIAGKLPNQPDNLITWIRAPQHVSPGTGMPEQPIPESDARDIAAYLLTLKR